MLTCNRDDFFTIYKTHCKVFGGMMFWTLGWSWQRLVILFTLYKDHL